MLVQVVPGGATGRASDLRFISRVFESCLSTIGELPKLCVKICPDSRLVCGPMHCHRPLLRSGLRQATYSCVPLSPSSITWYQSKGGDALRLGRWP